MSCQLPGGQNRRKPHGNLLTVCPFQGTFDEAQRNQQNREEGQEHIERHSLRNHAALRDDAGQRAKRFLGSSSQRHGGIIRFDRILTDETEPSSVGDRPNWERSRETGFEEITGEVLEADFGPVSPDSSPTGRAFSSKLEGMRRFQIVSCLQKLV